MIQKNLDLNYDNVVIGADLSAMAFSYVNKIPLIFLRTLQPYEYNEKENWKSLNDMWNNLSFVLAMNNFIPLSNKLSSIRIEDDKLVAVTKDNLLVNIQYNKLFISDDYKISGLPEPIGITNDDVYVLDYFNVKCGTLHDHDYLIGDDNFVKKVFFFKSKRIAKNFVNKKNKDCVAASKLKINDINVEEYSQNFSRLKTTKMMYDAGIKGYFDIHEGYHRKLELESDRREIHPYGKNKYDNFSNKIEFIYDEFCSILNNKHKIDKYTDFIKCNYGINI
jgi:hypothetical protein